MLNKDNKNYWQTYKPGSIPSPPLEPPDKLLKNIKGNILDVGTGDGKLAEKLSKDGHSVYGIDIAKNIIHQNKKRKTKVRYSIEDISSKTKFPDAFFELVIFRFTLVNIHKEGWNNVRKEVYRILKPNGILYILEPLVSDSYKKRYELAKNFIKDSNCVYVFYDKDLASKIDTKEELKKAIEDKKVSRIVKHYTPEELQDIFSMFEMEENSILTIESPSGFSINTYEGIFRKNN